MWMRLSDVIRDASRGWVALAATVIFVLFTVLVLPRQAASARAAGGGAGSPDTSFSYTAEDLYRLAEAYGEQGREAYVRVRYTFDVVWPLVYALFLCTAISWLFGRVFDEGSWWQRTNLMPLLGVLFDYLENLSTSTVMLRYPQPTPAAATLAPLFTMIKWAFVLGSFGLLLAGAVVGIGRLVTGKLRSH